VPFGWQGGDGDVTAMADGPTVRENVDAGVDVIDLAAMRDELEAARLRRSRGGE
jgi:hypothetical protein